MRFTCADLDIITFGRTFYGGWGKRGSLRRRNYWRYWRRFFRFFILEYTQFNIRNNFVKQGVGYTLVVSWPFCFCISRFQKQRITIRPELFFEKKEAKIVVFFLTCGTTCEWLIDWVSKWVRACLPSRADRCRAKVRVGVRFTDMV